MGAPGVPVVGSGRGLQPVAEQQSSLGVISEQQLADVLIARGRLREADLKRALAVPRRAGESLAGVLTQLGVVSERDLALAQSELLGVPLLEDAEYPDVPAVGAQLSLRFLKSARIIPVAEDDECVVVALANPLDRYSVDAIRLACAKPVTVRLGLPSKIDAAIERCYGSGKSALGQIVDDIDAAEGAREEDVAHLKDLASEAPVIRLVNLLIQRAVEARASDIHIEPFESRLKVRYRIDGVLRDVESPPQGSAAAVISRIKLMARLNIAERRLPQDGRARLRVQGKELDLRVSTVPTLYGESVVMRLLDKGSVVLDFAALGFGDALRERFLEVLALPHGIILVTGPTGSGKTTTLYAALHRLNTAERKIITVEDPVEYQLEGINQIQVKPQIGLTFANALRAIVRQDPDVIMIGEMRDLETARIAVQSALTGHLVLSTLHTNDAPSGITRLLDIGIDDFLLTSTVNGILAQRLVRSLCERCKAPYRALPETIEQLQLERYSTAAEIVLHRPVGCDACAGTGYIGRTAILEWLVMSDPVRRLVMRRADAGELQRAALEDGMRTMYADGLAKALAGITTVEEVLRVTQD
jgi:general secretion pathway protein E